MQRIKGRVDKEGPAGVLHGNCGKTPANKVRPDVREQILGLARNEYKDYNFSHLADTLEDEHGIKICDETLRLWLRPEGHGSKPRKSRRHRKRRTRRPKEGELLFLDGSPHRWFGSEHGPVTLLLTTDDATGKALNGIFDKEETRDGRFKVCHDTFKKHGLPGAYYLDGPRLSI